tara:strand:+ start:19 stop:738 length:720 start_codon:yes stop_codon:yes gene_type:complete
MVYFLGRDVSVYIGTESNTAAMDVGVLYGVTSGAASATVDSGSTSGMVTFAKSLNTGTATSAWTAESDITGVDVSIGATDEDVTYIGQKGTGKVEIKKEYTISLTRKKKNKVWDVIFNGPSLAGTAEDAAGKHGARWGLAGDLGNSTAAAPKIANGANNPKDYNDGTYVEAGYRLFVVLQTGDAGESMAFPNCLITSHTVSVNADGTSEETMEFVTQQNMLSANDGDMLNVTQTALADY